MCGVGHIITWWLCLAPKSAPVGVMGKGLLCNTRLSETLGRLKERLGAYQSHDEGGPLHHAQFPILQNRIEYLHASLMSLDEGRIYR